MKKIQVPAHRPSVGFTTRKKFEETYDVGEKVSKEIMMYSFVSSGKSQQY
jgi:hypothetical protein